MGMDTSICVACGMMWEWEAVALGEQLDTWTVGAVGCAGWMRLELIVTVLTVLT